jgi:hypothetical protein
VWLQGGPGRAGEGGGGDEGALDLPPGCPYLVTAIIDGDSGRVGQTSVERRPVSGDDR